MKPATSLTWSQAPLGWTFALGADGPAEAVLAGLEHHHVDAVGGAIGEFRALAGLEVEPVAFALLGLGVLHDLEVVTSKILLQSSVPARLWNIVATVPG